MKLGLITLEAASVDEVLVRSAITCETRHGICAQCYGRDLARGHLVNMVKRLALLPHSRLVSRVLSLPCVPSTLVVRHLEQLR